MALEGLRIAIAAANEEVDDGRFCAEVYLDDKYVGRVCEIVGSTNYTIELVSGADEPGVAAAFAAAEAKLRKHKFG